MKVIIWGHKLHSHTHSYIHYAFHRAFQHMGYETYWFDNTDDVSKFDFSNCIFLTEGQVDDKIPRRNDCKYILHNCNVAKHYEHIVKENILQIQVYYGLEKVGNFTYYGARTLYMPWATDLLPHEFEGPATNRGKNIFWVGTVGAGKFGNIDQLSPFISTCALNGIGFLQRGGVSADENRALVAASYMAPAINGHWQVEKGYIPCRIFKNISYGQFGLTNNRAVQKLFHDQLIYADNGGDLFNLAKENLASETYESRLIELMEIVKAEHTYINRIETILKFM